MKVTVLKIKTVALIALMAWSVCSFAQDKTVMYVMKNSKAVFKSPVSDIDNVSFDKAAPDDALILRKNDGSPVDKILLNNIRELSLTDEKLSVETLTESKMYAYNDIAQLHFGDINDNGINNPLARNGIDVFMYADYLTVESRIAIKSLALFGIDGKMIVETRHATSPHATSLQWNNTPAGIYLLRVETEQGTVVKKVVKPVNK